MKSTHAIRCPLCRKGCIIDAADGTDATKLNLYGPRQSTKAEWFTKCPKCGERIGIAFPKTEYRAAADGKWRRHPVPPSTTVLCQAHQPPVIVRGT